MTRGVVRMDRVSFAYATSGGEVLRNITLHVAPGEIFAVLGPSGCGKTTLLHLAAGFLRPCSGRLLVSGREPEGPGADRALVFQAPHLFPWLNTLANISYGTAGGKGRRAGKERARELVRLVGLSGFEKAYPHQLSGGMRQRAALARALALEPDVLLMDEPFSALDPLGRQKMQDELLRISREIVCSIIFVTHDIREAAYLGDRVMVLSAPPASPALTLAIDLPRPRCRTARELWEKERQLYSHCGCCLENIKEEL